MSTASNGAAVGGKSNLIPFRKGDPRINREGNVPKKLRKLRKGLEALDAGALKRLGALIVDGSDKEAVTAIGIWARYRIPVPKDNGGSKSEEMREAAIPARAAKVLAMMAAEEESK